MKTARTWALEWMYKAGAGIDEYTQERDAEEIAVNTRFMADVQRDAVASTSELREAVRVLREPLLIAASYDQAPPTIGVRFWLDDVRKALAATAHLAPGGDE